MFPYKVDTMTHLLLINKHQQTVLYFRNEWVRMGYKKRRRKKELLNENDILEGEE